MPVIPGYDQKRNIQARPPAVKMQGEAEQAFQGSNEIIGTLTKITQAWSDAHDTMQATKASADYAVALSLISEEAKLDQNYDNFDLYADRIMQAKRTAVSSIDNKAVADKMEAQFDMDARISAIKIQSDFRQKFLAENKVNLQLFVDQGIKDQMDSVGKEKELIDTRVFSQINDNYIAGNITLAEREAFARSYKVGSLVEKINAETAMTLDDSKVYKELKKNKDLTSEDRLKLLETLENKIYHNQLLTKREEEKAKYDMEQTQLSNETQLLDNLASVNPKDLTSGDIDRVVSEVNKMSANGLVGEEFAIAYTNVLLSNKLFTDKEMKNKKGLMKYAEDILLMDDPQLRRRGIVNMMKNVSSGQASIKDLTAMIISAKKIEESRNPKWKENLIGAMIAIANIGGSVVPLKKEMFLDKEQITSDLLLNISNGMNPNEAYDSALYKEQVNKNTDRAKYHVGDIVPTNRGEDWYVWGFYPDGEAKVLPARPPQAIIDKDKDK